MRENIGLFRGKRIDNGEWVEGWLIDYRPYREWVCITVFADGSDGYTWRRFEVEVDPDTMGECTGLKDKNGKLIFEGDIITACVYEREYEDEYMSYIPTKVAYCGGYFYPFHLDGCWRSGVSDVEIIGNIVDNPELLKGGEG